jgi:hypothetical protein
MHCQAHNQTPDLSPKPIRACFGETFTCAVCRREVCAGFGGDEPDLDLCDSCWAQPMSRQGIPVRAAL